MRARRIVGSVCVILISQVFGCQQDVGSSVPSNGADAIEQTTGTLLARVQLSNNHRVDIYEFAPGELAVNERGVIGEPLATNEEMIVGKSMADLYQFLTENRPELRKDAELALLKEADERGKAYNAPLVKEEDPPALASGGPDTSSSAFDPFWDNWFITNFCGTTGTPTPGVIHSDNNGFCLIHWNGDASWAPGGTRFNFYSAVDNWDTANMNHYGYTWTGSWTQAWNHSIAPANYEQWGWAGVGTRKVRAVGNAYNFGGKWSTPDPCGFLGTPCCGGGLCNQGSCQPSGLCSFP